MAKIIQVTYGTTTRITTDTVPSDTKLSAFIAEKNLQSEGSTVQLNGIAVGKDQWNKTFEDFTKADNLTLMSVVNAKNA
jgi:sulfur carrier protein ThiS